jgi:hypothetical protein
VVFRVCHGVGVCREGDLNRGAEDKKSFTLQKDVDLFMETRGCFAVDQVFLVRPNT